MTSDQSDKKDETGMEMSGVPDEAFDDIPEDDFDEDMDVDITGDENIDFADEDDEDSGRGGGRLKKILAPVLVLAAAAGVGGFIILNPQILGQGGSGLAGGQQPYVAPQAFSMAAPESNSGAADVADSGFGAIPPQPQPVVNQEEPQDDMMAGDVPRLPDLTEEPGGIPGYREAEEPVPDHHMADAPLPDVTEDFVVADAPVEEPEEVEPSAPAVPEGFGGGPGFSAGSVSEDSSEPAEVSSGPEMDDFPAPTVEKEMAVAESFPEEPPIRMAQVEDVSEDVNMPLPIPDSLEPVAEVSFPEEGSGDVAVKKKTVPSADQGAAQAPVTPSRPSVPVSDTYYDGLVPTGPMAKAVGTRKVDPATEPASQYVVVKKGYEATDTEAVLASANRALTLKLYDSALDMFDQLYEKNSRDPRILMGRAVAQQNLGMADSAIRSYEQVLDVSPNNADAMLNMLGLLRQQYPSVALRRLMDLYDKHPDNAGIAAQIGVTQADLGHADEAMRYLGVAASLEPNNAQHVFNMAIIADRGGDAAQAVKYYEKALELDAVYSSGRSISREVVYDRLATLRRRR